MGSRWGVTEWRNRDLSRIEERGWLGRRGREPDQDPPEGHSEAFGRDYGAKALGVLADSADRDGTGTER